MTDQKINAIMIVEMAGRPPEHLIQILREHIAQLRNYKGVKHISEKISEPRRLDIQNQEMYTSFAEIEVETQNMQILMDLVFDFMPSSIEIVDPGEIILDIAEATSFINTLAGRLHRYDEIAKLAQLKMEQLTAQLQKQNQEMQKKMNPIKEEKKKKRKKK